MSATQYRSHKEDDLLPRSRREPESRQSRHHRSSSSREEERDSDKHRGSRRRRSPQRVPSGRSSSSRYQRSGTDIYGRDTGEGYRDRRSQQSDRRSRSPPSTNYGSGRKRQHMGAEEERQLKEWVDGEDKFALRQAKKGAVIRIKEGRARPVDWLALNLQAIDKDKDVYDDSILDTRELDIPVPYAVIEGLGLNDVQKLESDVQEYLRLESSKFNRDFWEVSLLNVKLTITHALTLPLVYVGYL